MSWVGLVWDLGEPPREVVRNERKVGAAVLERVARQLAEQFAASKEEAWRELQNHRPHLPQMPQLPSVAEVRERLLQAYADSPSTDEIVARARQLLAERFAAQVLPELAPHPA